MAQDSSFSSMIGITRSVVPSIRVLNNFLSNFFGYIPKTEFEKYICKFEQFEFSDEIQCKETSEEYKQLKKSFSEWIKTYCVYEYDTVNSRDSVKNVNQWFPLIKGLIFEDKRATTHLNDILIYMLYYKYEGDISELYENHCAKLEAFLYSDLNSTGYNGFIQDTIKSIFKGLYHEDISFNEIRIKRIQSLKNDLSNMNISYLGKVTSLCIRFRQDFEAILENKWLLSHSIYTRIYYLQLMLNFYITLYTIRRTNNSRTPPYVLCKGNPSLDSDGFNAACVQLYGSIREGVREKAELYIKKILKEYLQNKEGVPTKETSLFLRFDENTNTVVCSLNNEDVLFKEMIQDFPHIGRKNVDEFIKDLKILSNLSFNYKRVNYNDMARVISKSLLKRSAFIDSVTQIFSTHGRQSSFVFPTGPSRYKFFSLSSDLCNLLLRLYMQEKNKKVDTVENFIHYLNKNYRISLMQSEGVKNFIESRNIKFPSNDEFIQNFNSFIETLSEINAVKKYSDTSYFITLPGESGRGEFIQ